LRTAVEEIEVGAGVDVLLHNALAPTNDHSWLRDGEVLALGAHAAPPGADTRVAPRLPSDATGLLGERPIADATQPGTAPGEVASVAGILAPVLASAMPVAAIAAGTMLVGFALYHLIKKNAILKNKVRSAIAEQVLAHPGSTITEIAASVGVTHQTASYHLRLLQEHGLVIGVERGNKRLYFRNDGSFNQEERGLVAVLRDPESMRVLQLIRENPWIMKNEAAMALGVSRNTLNWHLQKLLSAGLVSEARENGHCFLFCNKQANGVLLGTVAQKVEERRALSPAAPEVPGMPVAPHVPMDGSGLGHPA
ncbi:MAG: helix-turn-helix domain-containing protein, partial [Halobacteriales archaeon]|nr:helix-turn-helix domain-containing protein [Halobacteriales archaeon]